MDAAAIWATRARAEADASGMFAHLLRGLEAVGAHRATVELAHRAVADETRHQGLCDDLVRHFGGTPEPFAAPPRSASTPTRERVLIEVVGMCCINETVSAAVLSRMQQNTRGHAAHGVITEILRDEVQHARLGWSHLAFEHRRGPVDGVSLRLQELIDAAVRDLDAEPDTVVTEAIVQAGGLGRRARVAALREALESVVFPGLVAHGVPVPALRLPT